MANEGKEQNENTLRARESAEPRDSAELFAEPNKAFETLTARESAAPVAPVITQPCPTNPDQWITQPAARSSEKDAPADVLREHNYSYQEPFGEMRAGYYWCLCGWQGPDRASYWKHLPTVVSLASRDAVKREALEKAAQHCPETYHDVITGCECGEFTPTTSSTDPALAFDEWQQHIRALAASPAGRAEQEPK